MIRFSYYRKQKHVHELYSFLFPSLSLSLSLPPYFSRIPVTSRGEEFFFSFTLQPNQNPSRDSNAGHWTPNIEFAFERLDCSRESNAGHRTPDTRRWTSNIGRRRASRLMIEYREFISNQRRNEGTSVGSSKPLSHTMDVTHSAGVVSYVRFNTPSAGTSSIPFNIHTPRFSSVPVHKHSHTTV